MYIKISFCRKEEAKKEHYLWVLFSRVSINSYHSKLVYALCYVVATKINISFLKLGVSFNETPKKTTKFTLL